MYMVKRLRNGHAPGCRQCSGACCRARPAHACMYTSWAEPPNGDARRLHQAGMDCKEGQHDDHMPVLQEDRWPPGSAARSSSLRACASAGAAAGLLALCSARLSAMSLAATRCDSAWKPGLSPVLRPCCAHEPPCVTYCASVAPAHLALRAARHVL